MQKVKQCLEARSNRYSARLIADGMRVFQFDLGPVVHKIRLLSGKSLDSPGCINRPARFPPVRLGVDKTARMA
jgi:hypothetical protein